MQTLVTLPHGYTIKGSPIRHVQLREINGHDEQYLASVRNDLPVFLLSAGLLARVASFVGTSHVIESGDEVLRNLTVGDRVLLVLHLYRLTFGETMHCTLDCPACSKKMSLDLSTSTLLSLTAMAGGSYDLSLDGLSIQVRPATLSDQQMLLSFSNGSNSDAAHVLARSCIISSDPSLPATGFEEKTIAAIGEKLREIDPLADIVMDMECPSCNHAFHVPFDVEAFFLEELAMQGRQLDREVHWLAFHYHWSEDSILSLTASRRQHYIELINETLSEVS